MSYRFFDSPVTKLNLRYLKYYQKKLKEIFSKLILRFDRNDERKVRATQAVKTNLLPCYTWYLALKRRGLDQQIQKHNCKAKQKTRSFFIKLCRSTYWLRRGWWRVWRWSWSNLELLLVWSLSEWLLEFLRVLGVPGRWCVDTSNVLGVWYLDKQKSVLIYNEG